MNRIPIYKPYITKNTKKFSKEAIESGWVSSLGPYIEKATELFKEKIGAENALLLSNGTTATHCILKAIKNKFGNEYKDIIVPNNVFVAAWNAMLHDDYFEKMYFVEPNKETWNIDLSKIPEINHKSILLLVHNIGNIIDISKINKEKYLIIEDNCEGLFGKYGDDFSGTKSFCSSFSFFANKSINSGEGGAIVSPHKDVIEYVKNLTSHGMTEKKFVHNKVGYNYRMTNVQAAMLYGQLNDLEEILEKKKDIFKRYKQFILQNPDLELQKSEENTLSADWMFSFRSKNPNHTYEKMKECFDKEGIETRPIFYSSSKHSYLLTKKINKTELIGVDNTEIADNICSTACMLPSYPQLSRLEQEKVIKTLNNFLKENK